MAVMEIKRSECRAHGPRRIIAQRRLIERGRCCQMCWASVRGNHCLPGNRLNLSVVGAGLCRLLHKLCQAHTGHLGFLSGALEGGQ